MTGNDRIILDGSHIHVTLKGGISTDTRVTDGAGRTQIPKVSVGNLRARFDLLKQENDTGGIGSVLIDFDHQFIFQLIPRAELCLQIEGSARTPFYNGA